jgi:hypothetical protein
MEKWNVTKKNSIEVNDWTNNDLPYLQSDYSEIP